jgi:eukaryotic-like serine/threonine-protein kinase
LRALLPPWRVGDKVRKATPNSFETGRLGRLEFFQAFMPDTPENLRESGIEPTVRRAPGAEKSSRPTDSLIGMKLGEFLVEEQVAAGGMGIVYRGQHPLIGRKVAIKVLRPSFAADPEAMSRFLKEARAIAAIQHPGVIDIMGFGEVPQPDGRQYMVMEFLEGETLEALMQRERPMSPGRALVFTDEILDALWAAHRSGVVHRDLKPANIYIQRQSTGTRNAKLVDFGLARVASHAEVDRGSGRASLVAGTPEYVSPEQARGLAATPRTDLYCLGVTLFEMVTGRLPFTGTGVLDLMNAHVNQPAPRATAFVPGLPPALDQFIAQLLKKDPDERPVSADVARQMVQRLRRELQTEATAVSSVPSGPDSETHNSKAPATGALEPTRRLALAETTEPHGAPLKPDVIGKDPLAAKATRERQLRGLAYGIFALGLVITVALVWKVSAREDVQPPPAPAVVAPPPPIPPPTVEPPKPEPVPPPPPPIVAPVVKPEPVVQAPKSKAPSGRLVSVMIQSNKAKKPFAAHFSIKGRKETFETPRSVDLVVPGTYTFRFWNDEIPEPGIEKMVTLKPGMDKFVMELPR